MNAVENLKTRVAQTADEARHQVVSARIEKKMQNSHDELLGLLKDQQQELKNVRRDLKRQKSGGGFPWGLVLLVGAGYALYRTNPSVRDRVQGLLDRVDPGVKGNVTRAGDAVKDAASDLGQGKNPTDAFQRVAGETQRAGEKAVDGARDTWQDIKDGTRQAADNAKPTQPKGVA